MDCPFPQTEGALESVSYLEEPMQSPGDGALLSTWRGWAQGSMWPRWRLQKVLRLLRSEGVRMIVDQSGNIMTKMFVEVSVWETGQRGLCLEQRMPPK